MSDSSLKKPVVKGRPERQPDENPHRAIIAIACVTLFFAGWWGLGWGLPSAERLDLLASTDREETFRLVTSQTTRDQEEKLRSALTVPLAGVSSRSLSDDPVARARAVRRFLTFSTDWDENHTIRSLAFMRPGRLDFNPRMFVYGGLAIYPVGGLIGVAAVTGLLPRPLDGSTVLRHPDALALMYQAGRLWTLVLTVLSIPALWWATKQGSTPRLALLAALLYATFTPLHAWLNLLKPHLPALGFIVLAWGFAVRAASRSTLQPTDQAEESVHGNPAGQESAPTCPDRVLGGQGLHGGVGAVSRNLVWSTVCVAMAASLVPTSALALVLPLIAAWQRGRSLCEVIGSGVRIIGLFGVLFVVCNPYFILDFATFRSELKHVNSIYHYQGSLKALLCMLQQQLFNALPVPLIILAAIGVITPACGDRMLTGVIPLAYLVWGAIMFGGRPDPTLVRFVLPALPFLAVWMARGYDLIRRRSPVLAVAIVSLGCAWSLAVDLSYVWDRLQASRGATSELEAARWIRASIPAGEEIGFVSEPIPRKLPPIDPSRYRLVPVVYPALPGPGPRWIVSTEPYVPPGYEQVARFVGQGPLVGLVTHRVDSLTPIPEDLLQYRVSFAGFPLAVPLQFHQIPIHVYVRGTAGRPHAAGRPHTVER